MMTPERQKQVDQLFTAALEREPAERASFLKAACAGDEELRRELESLLVADRQAGSFLSKPVVEMVTEGKGEDPPGLLVGRQFGAYEILSLLGAGGMGEVYEAADAVLKRHVAIKVLPSRFSQDPERMARFEREAKLLASLNHSNIATIHSLERSEDKRLIVMELVPGPSLEEKLKKGPLPVEEALNVCQQIAEGLEAAHVRGIIHRDLKPANIKITQQQKVKILDLGLATALTKDTPAPDLSKSPKMTGPGVILGTAMYMSPEQARGKEVDERTDLWSFGCVLYEALTSKRLFAADSVADTVAKVLKSQPDLESLPANTPPSIRTLLRRCLQKDLNRRLGSIRDIRIEIEEALAELRETGTESPPSASPATVQKPGWKRLDWTVGLVVGAGVAFVAIWVFSPDTGSPEPPLRVVPLTSYPGREQQPTFSPDGDQIAFVWDGEKQDNSDIYVKLVGPEKPLRLTNHPDRDFNPAWSPDGRWIAFLRGPPGERPSVMLIPPLGGTERRLAETDYPVRLSQDWTARHLAWSADSKWLAIIGREALEGPIGLFLLSIATGEKKRLTSTSAVDWDPAFSPDGRTLVFSRSLAGGERDLYLLALSENLEPIGEPKRLTFDDSSKGYPAWSADGREIVFTSRGKLWRVSASGRGKPRQVETIGERGFSFGLSRRGHRLAYTKFFRDPNIWRVELTEGVAS